MRCLLLIIIFLLLIHPTRADVVIQGNSIWRNTIFINAVISALVYLQDDSGNTLNDDSGNPIQGS